MAASIQIFISAAAEDRELRDALVEQVKQNKVPIGFVDIADKQPWDARWKAECRTKVKSCAGLIAIITENLRNSDGAKWEIQCANEEGIPVLGIYETKNKNPIAPAVLARAKNVPWTWHVLVEWLWEFLR